MWSVGIKYTESNSLNALKTLSARLRGSEAELKEMGEDTEGMVESTSKLRDLVLSMTDFDIMIDEDNFKSIYDIIVGIGEVWDELSDVDQAALLEKLAGKQQSNILASAFANVDRIKEAYKFATDSQGSAMREQENWNKSLQASLNKLSASWEEFSTHILNSKVIKFFVDGLTSVVDILNEIPAGFEIAFGGATIALINHLANSGLSTMRETLEELVENIHKLANTDEEVSDVIEKFEELADAVDEATDSTDLNEIAQEALAEANGVTAATEEASAAASRDSAAANLEEVGSSEAEVVQQEIENASNLENAASEAASAVGGLTGALTKLGNAGIPVLSKLANFLLTPQAGLLAFIAAVAGIGLAINHIATASDRANEKLKDTKDEIDSISSNIDTLNNQLNTNKSTLDELNQIEYPSLAEQEEVDRLERENELLEAQIELEKQKKALKEKEAADNAVSAYNTQYARTNLTDQGIANKKEDVATNRPFSGFDNDFGYEFKDTNSDIAEGIALYQTLQEKIENVDKSTKEGAEEYQAYSKRLEEVNLLLQEDVLNLKEQKAAIENIPVEDRTQDQAEALEKIKDTINSIYKYTGNKQGLYDNIVNDEKNKDYIKNLKESIIKDSDEVVDAYNNAKDKLDGEIQKTIDYGVGDHFKEIKDGTLKSVFGNINMDERYIIHWSDALKKKYKDQLDSWNYDPEIGGIDTVFGGSDSFGLNGEEIEVAYSPIVQVDKNEDGVAESFEFLGQETAKNYIQGILNQAEKDGDTSIAHILELDKNGIKDMEVYDSQGRKVGETFVHGLIAEVGEDAVDVGSLLHFAGEEGGYQLAQSEFDKAKQDLENLYITEEDLSEEFKQDLDKNGLSVEDFCSQINSEIDSSIDKTRELIEELDEIDSHLPFEDVDRNLGVDFSKEDTGEYKNAEYENMKQNWMNVNSDLKDTMSEEEFAEAADFAVKATVRFDSAISDLSSNLDTYRTTLKEANKENNKSIKNSVKYSDTVSKLSADISGLANIEFNEELTTAFLDSKENAELLKKAINGDKKALEEFIDKARNFALDNVNVDDIAISANLDVDEFGNQFGDFVGWLEQHRDLGTVDAAAGLDSTNFFNNLRAVLAAGGEAAQKLDSLFSSLGWDLEYDMEEISPAKIGTQPTGVSNEEWNKTKASVIKNIRFKRIGGNTSDLSGLTGLKNTGGSGGGSSGGGGGGGGGGGSASEPTKTPFDWIERKIKTFTDLIDDLNQKVANTWLPWTTRNSSLKKTIKENQKLLKSYQKSTKSYQRALNNIAKGKNAEGGNNKEWGKLPEKYKKLVKEGKIGKKDLEIITDKEGKDLAGQIQAYMDYWDKIIEADKNAYSTRLTIQDQYQQLAEQHQQQFDAKREKRNAKFSVETAKYDRISLAGIPTEKEIDAYYKKMSKVDNDDIKNRKKAWEEAQKDRLNIDKSYDKEIDKAKKKRDKAKTNASKLKKKYGKNNPEYKAAIKEYKDLQKDYAKIKKKQEKNKKQWMNSEARDEMLTTEYTKQQEYEEAKTKKIYQDSIDRFQAYVDSINQIYEIAMTPSSHALDVIDQYATMAEASGKLIDKKWYEGMNELHKSRQKMFEDQKKDLEAKVQDMISNKKFDVTSPAVKQVYDQILEAEKNSIDEQIKIIQNNETIKQQLIDILNLRLGYYDTLQNEISFYKEALSLSGDLFDVSVGRNNVATGQFTDLGLATLGLDVASYKNLEQAAKDAEQAFKDYQDTTKNPLFDATNKNDIDHLNTLRETTNKLTLDWLKSGQEIANFYKQQFQAVLKELQKAINLRKENLNLQKSEYDYNKKIRNQTRDLNVIRKQLSAFRGDETEENRARIQRLQVQLKEAEESLEDTEYEKWVSDTNEMLDDMYKDFEDLYERLGKDTKGLIERAIKENNDGNLKIQDTITANLGTTASAGTMSDNLRLTLLNTGNIDANTRAVNANILNLINRFNANDLWGIASEKVDGTFSLLDKWLKGDSAVRVILDNAGTPLGEDEKTSDIIDSLNLTPTPTVPNIPLPTPTGTGKNTVTAAGKKVDYSVDSKGNISLSVNGNKFTIPYEKIDDMASSILSQTGVDITTLDKYYKQKTWFKSMFGASPTKIPSNKAASYVTNQKYTEADLKALLKVYGVSATKNTMKAAYKALGESDKYTGSKSQIQKLIRALKAQGFATGGSVAGTFRRATGEDGLALVRKGEYVLTPDMLKDALAVVNPLVELSKDLKGATSNDLKTKIEMGDVNFSVTLPNVKNYDEFKASLIGDKQFERVIQEVSIGRSLGNNSLKKYSIR